MSGAVESHASRCLIPSMVADPGGMPNLQSTHARREANRGEPQGAARLPLPRALRGGHRADRKRGQVAARGPGQPPAGVRGRARGRSMARRRAHRPLRAGGNPEPRAGARPEAAAAPAGARLALRQGAGEGPDARSRCGSTSRTAARSSSSRSPAARSSATSGASSPSATPTGRSSGRSKEGAD